MDPRPAVTQEADSLRRPRFAAPLLLLVLAALFVALVPSGGAEPAAIENQRAQVQRLQAELDQIGVQVSEAAEAHNGAVYELGQVRERIGANTRALVRSERELTQMQAQLEQRLLQLYTRGDTSALEVLLTTGSLSQASEQQSLIERIGAHDAQVVQRLKHTRTRLADIRRELVEDRATAATRLQEAEREKARIEGLLSQRQSVFNSANSRLQRLVAAEQERQRRAAAEEARLARQRLATQRAQERAAENANRPDAGESTPATGGDTDGATNVGGDSDRPAAGESTPAAEPEAPAAAPALPSGSGNAAAANVAMQQLGVPYRWGGASPSTGFDCSGLAAYAYAQIGKSVPHYTVAAYNAFPKVPAASLQVGDLVFFRSLGHMGIYVGGGQYVHAPQTGDVVKVTPMSSRSDYVGAVRP